MFAYVKSPLYYQEYIRDTLGNIYDEEYRMAPNFRGAQSSPIGLPKAFAEIIFADGEPSDLLQC